MHICVTVVKYLLVEQRLLIKLVTNNNITQRNLDTNVLACHPVN